MRISDLLTPGLVKVRLQSEEKEEVFEEILQLFLDADLLQDRHAALDALLRREEQLSTGIGNGLGVPHGKIEEAKGLMMALGVAPQGIEYEALDDEPVCVVLMVFAEVGNPGPHIEALAEISRLFSIPGFTEKLRQAASPDKVLELIRGEE